ncbi:hypothetical protein [Phenylobacterium sp.]|uniref:hypothetical protein n=1 Tax=Phenylobacterium sp. TaxID=1871053 RepID=UPI0025F75FE0|nr:hypothetical protein [Phenylobacterium sp.]
MALGCLLSACLLAHVDAAAGSQVRPQSAHRVAPAEAGLATDPTFQETAGEVRNALRAAGFTLAEGAGPPAQVVVIVAYGVDAPRVRLRARTEDVAAFTPGGSPSTTGAAGRAPSVDYGAVGTRTVTLRAATSVRHVSFAAYDAQAVAAGQAPPPLWTVTVTSEGADDIGAALPAMIVAAAPWFGKSTGRRVDVATPLEGRAVEAVRRGVGPPK